MLKLLHLQENGFVIALVFIPKFQYIYIYPKKIETFFEDVTTTKRQGCFFPRFLKAGRTIWEKFREKKHTNMEFPRMYAESIDRSGILKYSLQKCVERSYLDHFYASKLFHL